MIFHKKMALLFILCAVSFLLLANLTVETSLVEGTSGFTLSKIAIPNIETKDIASLQKINIPGLIDCVKAKEAPPSRLSIPSINVSTAIDYVGLTSEGDMDMISGTENVAWFEKGPVPGEIGSAVIGGHYGYPAPAVFRNLNELKMGDSVYVIDIQGVKKQFIVKAIKIYKENDVVPDVFSSTDGIAHLNIITCNGTWIPSLQTYNKRLVVFTDLVSCDNF